MNALISNTPQQQQWRPRISSYIAQNITIGERFRTVTEDAIQAMMASIDKIGLRTPITVRETEDDLILVTGCCRLLAVRRLGWLEIDACVMPDNAIEDDIIRWELAENLHRKDLTVQERAEHVAEWVKLAEKERTQQPAQVAPPVKKHGHAQASTGINAAVRDLGHLGIDRTEAQRSMKIAGMEAEAKEAAREHGLGDNQAALLEVAKAPPDQQVGKVYEIADLKAARKAAVAHKRNRETDRTIPDPIRIEPTEHQAATRPGPRLAMVDGKSIEETAREAARLSEGGLSMEDLGARFGLGLETIRRMIDIVVIADRDDLPDEEHEIGKQAFAAMVDDGSPTRAHKLVASIAERVWGPTEKRRAKRSAIERSRTDNFERAYNSLSHVCAWASEIKVPHLNRARSLEIDEELKQATASLNTLHNRIVEPWKCERDQAAKQVQTERVKGQEPAEPLRLLFPIDGEYDHHTADELELDEIMQLVCPSPNNNLIKPEHLDMVTHHVDVLIRFIENDPAGLADYARRFVANRVAECQQRYQDGQKPKQRTRSKE